MTKVLIMKIYKSPEQDALNELLKRPVFETVNLDESVASILAEVKEQGDKGQQTELEAFEHQARNRKKAKGKKGK